MEHLIPGVFHEKTQQLCLVKFGTDWCAPCKVAKNILKQIETETNLPTFEVDVEKHPMLFDVFGIKKIPLVVLYKDSEPLYHFKQDTTKSEYLALIERYRNGAVDAKEVSG
jgi:putative thioredoxin